MINIFSINTKRPPKTTIVFGGQIYQYAGILTPGQKCKMAINDNGPVHFWVTRIYDGVYDKALIFDYDNGYPSYIGGCLAPEIGQLLVIFASNQDNI